MDYRKFAIRIVYASISIAVAAGILTLFAPGAWDVIGRLLATAISTALAAALLLVSIKLLETPTTRPIGITIGILVCCIYVSIVCAIWVDIINQPLFKRLEEKLAFTAILITWLGIPILVGAACISHPRAKLAGIVLSCIWTVVLLCWLFDIWTTGTFVTNVEYFTVPLMLFSPIALLVLIARNASVRLVGIIPATIGCLILQIAAFSTGGNLDATPGMLLVALVFGWASAELGLWNLITFRNQRFALPLAERIAAVLCGIALASACLIIWFEIFHIQTDNFIVRISASSGILASASVLGIVVSQLIQAVVIVKFDGAEIEASCPRCKKELVIPQGKSTCPYCTLQIKMRIESTGCRVCGYDISGSIESNCCPECGEKIIISGEAT